MSGTVVGERLLRAARLFASAIEDAGGRSMLVGGAACVLLGHSRRTKDLDFDLTIFNRRIKSELNKKGILIKEGSAPNRFSGNVPASLEKLDATSIDIVVKPGIESLLPYTKVIEGVTVINESLLLVRKIKCSTQRRIVQSGRVETDLRDAMFCVLKLAEEGKRVPLELQAAVLDEQIMRAFWKGVKECCRDDYSTFQFFLNEVGIGVKESLL